MILSLDCSTLTLSLALLRADGAVVDERWVRPPRRQSEALPLDIEAMLLEHGHSLKDLTGFVVGLGPGSFTGLRIALATVKGLAYALKVPLVGASSLAALAFQSPGPESVELVAIAVVKKGELYVGRYRRLGTTLTESAPETSWTVSQLAVWLQGRPDARVMGPGLSDYRSTLESLGVPSGQLQAEPMVPSAVALARLVKMPQAFDLDSLFSLEPHYLRGSGAEENPKFPPLPGLEPKARLKED